MTLPTYSFLPWGRRGISSQVGETESFGQTIASPVYERPQLPVWVHLKADNTPQTPQQVTLRLIGPGDIIGVNSDVIVKTEPRNWITNFEPHSFAFIDFYDEDFPWRYSPAVAASSNKKLRPWLTLVVLKESEFTRTSVDNAPLTAITLTGAASSWPLPKYNEMWAWAHVSAMESLDPTAAGLSTAITNLNTRLAQDPNIAISRILCPRRLEEDTAYYAFLIPTYETGRLAGLGLDPSGVEAQKAAWDNSSTPSTGMFPVYYEWYFRTGQTGDFEYLVRQLKPRILDQSVGRRPMDVQSPGYNITYTGNTGNLTGTLSLEGALRAIIVPTPPAPFPYSDPGNTLRYGLKDLINMGEDMIDPAYFTGSGNPWASTTYAGTGVLNDPVVAPPLYGRWHALKRKVTVTDNYWLNELNLDPRNRVAAALGGDFVRKNQEKLMDLAWDQLGEVIEANKRAHWGQVTLEASQAMHEKHLAVQPDEQAVAMTNRVLAKVKYGTTSILQQALSSKLPESAQSYTFRKVCRPTGAVMKRVDPTAASFNATIGRLAVDAITPVAPKAPPATVTFARSDMNSVLGDVCAVPNPASVSFTVSSPGNPPGPSSPAISVGFVQALGDYNSVFTAINWATPMPNPNFNMSVMASAAVDGIEPAVTHPVRFYDTVKLVKNGVVLAPPVPDKIVPAMAAPSFRMPLYQELNALGVDYFMPNLSKIPQNSITLLETNPLFIESFMVGANYEMARELLWREYPTDQRGTYFRHFWEGGDFVNTASLTDDALEISLRDIQDIHTWLSTSNLGTHGRTGTPANLVLAIRGDFLKKFPNAVIYAVEAAWKLDGSGNPDYNSPRIRKVGGQEKYPIFSAKIDPDITFIGFDLVKNTAIGNPVVPNGAGWFFVLMERPGEIRFGLDTPLGSPTSMATWNDLTWNNITVTSTGYVNLGGGLVPGSPADQKIPPITGSTVPWADDAAAMAMILYQNPVMVLIHAHEMIQ